MRLAGKGDEITRIEALLIKKGFHSQRNGHKSQYPVKVRCKIYIVGRMPVRVVLDRRKNIGTVTINDSELMAVCNKVGGGFVNIMSEMKKVPKHGYRRS